MEPICIYTGSESSFAIAWRNVKDQNRKIDDSNKEDTPGENSGNTKAKTNTANAANDPSKFDWVTERSSCSLPKVFNTLRLQVEEDVNSRNALRPNNSPYEFSVAEDVGEFTVLLKTTEASRSVVFNLAEHAIIVRDEQRNPMFEVAASLNDQGECRLKVNGEEREFWQVRRLALEDLMFRGP
jgi:hypothetical protein